MIAGAERLRQALVRAASDLGVADVEVELERPRQKDHGDLSSNIALKVAKQLGQKPRDVAAKITGLLKLSEAEIEKYEIAGPGFINFWLAGGALSSILPQILAANATFGRDDAAKGAPVNVEFVSANPTGPLHVGHGRQAVLGDTIATLLEWTGWRVTREFYYNDAGNQITNLALSVQARMRGGEIPEGGYHGEYVREIAEQYLRQHP